MRLLPRHRSLLWAAVMLGLVYVAGVGAVLFRPENSLVAAWWPAAGVAVALVVVAPLRARPALVVGIVLVSGLANFTGGRSAGLSLLFGLSNAAEAVVVSALLRGNRPEPARLEAPDDFFRLLLASTLGALAAGLGIGLSVMVTGGDGLAAARTVAPSHLAATLLILPLALVWHERPRLRRRLPELVVQSALLGLSVVVVFGGGQTLALAFLPLPLLVWAGIRFGVLVTSVQLLTLGIISTLSTARGAGPFGVGVASEAIDPATAITQVQTFLICAALLTFPPTLAIAQRAQLLRRLRDEQQRVTTTLETTAAIIVMTSAEGTVLRVNATTTRLTGFAEDELVGRPFWDTPMIPPERRELVRQMFAEPDGSNVVSSREADAMTASGERLRVIWNNNLVQDADGHVVNVVCTGTDVTNERSTTALLRHLLEAPVATALVGLDERGRIAVFNQGAQEMLNRRPNEVMGRPLSEIVVSPQAELYMEQTEELAREGAAGGLGAQTSDWTWRGLGGRHLTVSTTISVVENAVGATMGYLCVGRDVTEQRRTQEILVEALEKERHGMERLRRLDAAKSEFVSTVSHELRTPTTSIVGYTEMLRDGSAGEPTEEQIPMLDAIARNGKRLIAVASDLLTLSELESGDTSQWERSPVDLTAIVAQAEEAIRPLLAGRDLSVEFDVPDDPVTVVGDAAHLDRVLMNLLSNAVKFTPNAGHIGCRLQATRRWAQLEVSDTGIGIPEEEQAELFNKFFRSSTAQERAIQGTGLGLSIVDSIVAAHGGDIEVRSAHLQGTTFTVRLPTARPPAGLPGSRAVERGRGVRQPRQDRLTAEITALSEAVTMLGSSPTPQ